MDYTKSTNFATKDTLPPGSALKIVRGTEIDTEFNAIATAVATKADSTAVALKADLASPALTGNPTAPTATAGDNDTSIATTAFVSTAVATAVNNVGYPAFKNRIINGAMMIDQRNAGASVTANDGVFPVDRFKFTMSQSSKGTGQQSTTAPANYTNSLLFTSTSAYTVGAAENFNIAQYIEGFNVSDLGWGTASAATVTLSFWVRSSLTGTFGGSVSNSAANRSYPFSYTINAANTWEQKTVTIAGDTSGTWVTNNGIGLRLFFGLGCGASASGTAGSWSGSFFLSATGATSVVGTNGATFYITGVQLEKGSTATSFDYRPYGTELALCQRYLPFISAGNNFFAGHCTTTGSTQISIPFKVSTRVAPTGVTVVSPTNSFVYSANGTGLAVTSTSFVAAGTESAFLTVTAASGLVAGNGTSYYMAGSTTLQFTGCEL
jgi:hypothetical protein